MAIDRAEVERIAELARLEIAPERMGRMATELSAVLEFVAALGRLDLARLAPSTFAPAGTPLRADELDDRRIPAAEALSAATEHDDGFFLVPPIVENVNP
ncbi:MAG: hypothetical protein A2W00_07010 [Candidatus Eisenbacteria bacterium RBG_16_71_46]|nr:MAG: hypothetical protein A2W00_07010 [Candidatus Eisenbacteria bacterium RBG_16_71_46]